MGQWLLLGWAATRLVAVAANAAAGGDVLSGAASEEAALALLAEPSFDLLATEPTDVERLVQRGWHGAVRALVALSHRGSEDARQRVASQVRQAVQAERNRLDDIIRALDQNYGKAAEVSPAMQWAQNSTHVFLAVKFAQRWNAPGALEVENETVDISRCCFNFTAFGEHSFIRRRYQVSLELFRMVLPEASTWSLASVGRMTVTMAKATAGNWPRLVARAETAPKNLGIWRDMADKWRSELAKLPTLPADGSRGKKSGGASPSSSATPAGEGSKKANKGKGARKQEAPAKSADVDEDALDKEIELVSDCPKSSYSGTAVAELCAAAWPEVVEQPAVRGRRWLVEFYSSSGDGKLEAMKSLMPVWKRLADVFPSLVPLGRVGALDCGPPESKELCRKLGVTPAKLPQVSRWLGGSTADGIWTGSLDASIEDLAAFGGEGSQSAEL